MRPTPMRVMRRALPPALLCLAALAGSSAVADGAWRGLVVAPEDRGCPAYDSRDFAYDASGRGANENWLERYLAARLGAPGRESFRTPYTGALMVAAMERPCSGRRAGSGCAPGRPSGSASAVPYWYGPDRRAAEIEHLIARKEAHDSGLCRAPDYLKRVFANDPLNLTLATGATNRSKGARDAAEWAPSRNRCWWAVTSVLVRRKYELTIDAAERDALEAVLGGADCAGSPWVAVLDAPAPDVRLPILAMAADAAPAPAGRVAFAAASDALALYDDNGNGRITCAEARAHGIAPVRRAHPAYAHMDDRDGDGIVCE